MRHPNFTAVHARTLRQETAVSIGFNALVPSAIIWLLDAAPPQTIVGDHPLLGVIVPASGLATMMMTFVVTLIVRGRVAKGSVPALAWPRPERGLYRYIPQHLVLRALALGVLAIVLLVPPTAAIFAVADVLPFDRVQALAFNLGFGAVVGLVMTRFVVLTALADRTGAMLAQPGI